MNEQGHGWQPFEIKTALKSRGLRQSDIARQLGVSPVQFWQVVHGHRTSARVEEHIARLLGVPRKDIWPDADAAAERETLWPFRAGRHPLVGFVYHMDADSRCAAIRRMTDPSQLRAALRVPNLQPGVRKVINSRLNALKNQKNQADTDPVSGGAA
jgi:lambda repressor-like predicted transcriptional regulator